MDQRRNGRRQGGKGPGGKARPQQAQRPAAARPRDSFDPLGLAVVREGENWALRYRDAPVKTPGGHPVTHRSRRLIELIRREAEVAREFDAHTLSAYSQFATEVDYVAAGDDPVLRDLERLLAEEEPLLDRGEGDEEQAQLATWRFVTHALEDSNQTLPRIDESGEVPAAFVDHVRGSYDALSFSQRAGVIALYNRHHAGLLVPIAFARGRATSSEYAEALLAMHHAHPRMVEGDWNEFRNNFVIAREDASIVEEYLQVTGP